jgi:uncharacterized membrane protein YeiH
MHLMSSISVIDVIGIFGVVVFAVSGALAAGRYRMDIIGFILLGTVTAIGGGTMRDLVLGRPVFWVVEPDQLIISIGAAVATFFFFPERLAGTKGIIWSDALGLSAFAVQGAQAALGQGAHAVVAIVMGVMTAVGGGIIRDLLSGHHPFIVRGELYASTALAGALLLVVLVKCGIPAQYAEICGFLVTLLSRGATIIFGIRMGPPGEFITIGKEDDSEPRDRE